MTTCSSKTSVMNACHSEQTLNDLRSVQEFLPQPSTGHLKTVIKVPGVKVILGLFHQGSIQAPSMPSPDLATNRSILVRKIMSDNIPTSFSS